MTYKEDGSVEGTYGYSTYGNLDKEATTGPDDPKAPDFKPEEPHNVYRYSGKRWDPGSASYDMGFRDYSPGLNRFTSMDMYDGAFANMGLSSNPYTNNPYGFTYGNPISGVEMDGHIFEGIMEAIEDWFTDDSEPWIDNSDVPHNTMSSPTLKSMLDQKPLETPIFHKYFIDSFLSDFAKGKQSANGKIKIDISDQFELYAPWEYQSESNYRLSPAEDERGKFVGWQSWEGIIYEEYRNPRTTDRGDIENDRIEHVLAHSKTRGTNAGISAFNSDDLADITRYIDNAWKLAKERNMQPVVSKGLWSFKINMGESVGTRNEKYILLIFKPQTMRLVSAYPVRQ